jgi:hypothetical protein
MPEPMTGGEFQSVLNHSVWDPRFDDAPVIVRTSDGGEYLVCSAHWDQADNVVCIEAVSRA